MYNYKLYALSLAICITSACAKPYYLPDVKGWHNTVWKFPLIWAPNISHKGHEEIRFSGGWGKTNSEELWSYCFLWWIEGNAQLDQARLKDELKEYYTGLVKVGLSNYKRKADSAKDNPTIVTNITNNDNQSEIYHFTISMWDYVSERPIVLNVTSEMKSCSNTGKKAVFFAISPQPSTHKVWNQFAEVWRGFHCK